MKSNFEKELSNNGKLVYSVKGQSMFPLIKAGKDVVVIDKTDASACLRRLDIVLYKNNNGNYVLHRILKIKNDSFVICGDNCWKREFDINRLQIIGKLVEILRGEKVVNPYSRRNMIQAHLWCDVFFLRSGIVGFRNLINKIFNGKNK